LKPWGYPHGFYFIESVVILLHGFLGLFLVFPVGGAGVNVVIFHNNLEIEEVGKITKTPPQQATIINPT